MFVGKHRNSLHTCCETLVDLCTGDCGRQYSVYVNFYSLPHLSISFDESSPSCFWGTTKSNPVVASYIQGHPSVLLAPAYMRCCGLSTDHILIVFNPKETQCTVNQRSSHALSSSLLTAFGTHVTVPDAFTPTTQEKTDLSHRCSTRGVDVSSPPLCFVFLFLSCLVCIRNDVILCD